MRFADFPKSHRSCSACHHPANLPPQATPAVYRARRLTGGASAASEEAKPTSESAARAC
jgi:hypothetical protein